MLPKTPVLENSEVQARVPGHLHSRLGPGLPLRALVIGLHQWASVDDLRFSADGILLEPPILDSGLILVLSVTGPSHSVPEALDGLALPRCLPTAAILSPKGVLGVYVVVYCDGASGSPPVPSLSLLVLYASSSDPGSDDSPPVSVAPYVAVTSPPSTRILRSHHSRTHA